MKTYLKILVLTSLLFSIGSAKYKELSYTSILERAKQKIAKRIYDNQRASAFRAMRGNNSIGIFVHGADVFNASLKTVPIKNLALQFYGTYYENDKTISTLGGCKLIGILNDLVLFNKLSQIYLFGGVGELRQTKNDVIKKAVFTEVGLGLELHASNIGIPMIFGVIGTLSDDESELKLSDYFIAEAILGFVFSFFDDAFYDLEIGFVSSTGGMKESYTGWKWSRCLQIYF